MLVAQAQVGASVVGVIEEARRLAETHDKEVVVVYRGVMLTVNSETSVEDISREWRHACATGRTAVGPCSAKQAA